MKGESREKVAEGRNNRRRVAGALAILLAFASWETTEGGILKYRVPMGDDAGNFIPFVSLYPADLREAQLTRKPPGWLRWQLWREDFEEKYRKRKGIKLGPEMTADEKFAFAQAAKERYAEYIAQLDAPDLRGADLRNADMFRAFLPGANLVAAEMQATDLRLSQMQGADLTRAGMRRADLRAAEAQGVFLTGAQMHQARLGCSVVGVATKSCKPVKLQEANLIGANLQDANLRGAEMQGANLSSARMQRAVVVLANLQGATLRKAVMREANLSGAQMRGAVLRDVDLRKSDLFAAEMQGADLRGAGMQEADLRRANMQAAALTAAQFQDADCSGVNFRAAVLNSANVTCQNLTQSQLVQTVGNDRTVLPDGLTVVSCLEALSSGVEEALTHHPHDGARVRPSRAHVRDALLCDDGEQPDRVGRSTLETQ